MPQVILNRFGTPDEMISFEKGRFEKTTLGGVTLGGVTLGGVTLGRAVYEPGWKWSTHVGSKTGASLCQVEHVGLVQQSELFTHKINSRSSGVLLIGCTGKTTNEPRPLLFSSFNEESKAETDLLTSLPKPGRTNSPFFLVSL